MRSEKFVGFGVYAQSRTAQRDVGDGESRFDDTEDSADFRGRLRHVIAAKWDSTSAVTVLRDRTLYAGDDSIDK